jgi:predicted Zn finger-like uncharacterized protein
MKVSCQSCNSVLNIDDKKIPPGGARIKCPTCQSVFPVKPAPAPSAASPALVPLPGISAAPAQRQSWEEESTRVADMSSMPAAAIPGATTVSAPPTNVKLPPPARTSTNSAVPLPGISAAPAQRQSWEEEATRVGTVPLPGAAGPAIDFDVAPTGAVPLPGGAATAVAPAYVPLPGAATAVAPAHVPLPGPTAVAPAYAPPPPLPKPPPPPRPSGSIPLPGAASSIPLPGSAGGPASIPLPGGVGASSIPLPGAASDDLAASDDFGSVPLPGGRAPPVAGMGFDDTVELPGGSGDSLEVDLSGGSGAVPLPGEAPREYGGGFDFSKAPPAPAPGGFDFSEAPPAPAPGGFDFSEAPPAPAPVGGGFDFSEAPPPPAPGGFEFDAAPPPPAAAPGGFDFSDAPPPPAAGGFDFGAPPPPAPAAPPAGGPMGFGEVDFGGGGGDLEFDPTAAPGGKPPVDDLEADFSAPLPQSSAPAGPTDGLEMLSFIDKTAKEAGAKPEELLNVRRFHVKRRSGKVFGPFEEAVIVKMLEDGQLLGNEEVSLDAENWQPIGSEPALQAVIARLMEAPARSQTQMQMQAVDENKGPSMDRLKQLYEGRMAAVAVVQSKEPVPFKKKLPFIVLGVLLAASVLGGVFLGVATPYGFFALKLLFPAKVKPDTREFGYLQVARKGFLQDTWKSYKLAKDSANQALAIKEYPEARAVWCQAVFYLDRKYNKADPAELEQAQNEIVNIRLLGEKHPEVLKTEASAALSRKETDLALGTLADAVARDDGSDLELLFLRAEAYLQKKQPAQAKAEYEAIIKKDPKSARALHALGLLHKQQNEINEAAGKLAEALEADPEHLATAVELAEIAIVRRKELDRGNELLEKVLDDAGRAAVSSSSLGKALALKAEVLVVQSKTAEAVPLFEEAVKADPTNAFSNGRLGNAYAKLNLPEKAVGPYSVAVKSEPQNLEYTQGYLSTLIAVGRMDEATKMLETANTRFPGEATLSYLAALVADALGNSKEAEEAYKRAIAADPKIIDAYLFLSRNYMRDRRFKEAAPVLEQGLEQAPDNAAIRVGLGELALHERNLDRAEQEFKKAIELNPYSADAYLGASRVSLEREKYELAATQVEKALEINPRITGGRLQRGIALWRLGRLDDAITELEQAHEAAPKETEIVVTMGAVKFEKGDLNGALSHLNSALIAEPGHPNANFYLARLKNAKAEHTQAIEAMKRALDYNAKNPLYLYWYGRILADARKGDDALAELKNALAIEPKYADALEAIGKIYFERNDFKKAVSYYQQALDVDPARQTVRALIGDAQMKMEDWGGAIASYMQALDADPDLKAAYSKLGLAYQEQRQMPKAIEWYTKAVQAEPENADAWMALGYLFKDTGKKKNALTAFTKYLELKPEAENKKEVDEEIHFLKE